MKSLGRALGALAISCAFFTAAGTGVACAQDEQSGPITFSANVTLATDYRFRGISQTENDLALQGGFDATHESGFYVGTWASNLAGWGTFGGANLELDLYGGLSNSLAGFDYDVGVIWYVFPGGASRTAYGEIYGSIGKNFNGVDLSVGANYAPPQDALSLNDVNEDNIYIYSDAGYALGNTPFSVSAHIGYTDGNGVAGPNGWVPSPTGTYVDWSIGVSVDLPFGPLAASVTYVDTDISRSEAEAFQLINEGYRFGIGAATAVFAITGSF